MSFIIIFTFLTVIDDKRNMLLFSYFVRQKNVSNTWFNRFIKLIIDRMQTMTKNSQSYLTI